ncbi:MULTISPECIES: hypothetical protein [unclassified Pseudomonas]|uniref:hypothetical protein n=1 Tax=unclassified Pseudomonas TaxID=196821 RepID=UPI0009C6FDE7|nr:MULTISPECIES: hypothetical protein [unclassified Pseudomonas]OPK12105.1 hypothetical protein BZ163_00175 [Pseudomonas sp. VI4.1]QCY13899.1 hypothetical protein ELQ88_25740 [Pseudomonas sp. MPC6]
MNHNFCEAWHKETHVDLLAPRQPIAALEQARQTERLASVNAGIFKKVRDVDRDVAAAHYYQTFVHDLAKAAPRWRSWKGNFRIRITRVFPVRTLTA